MKSIFLIGFMGSGKTSTAKELASYLDAVYCDTDLEIEKETGLKIPEIFQNKGESFFRDKESEILRSVPLNETVVATGGGIIGEYCNRTWLQKNGTVVFLETEWEEIVDRLGEDSSRPLWNSHEKQELFKSRKPLYKETADFIVTTDGKNPEEVAKEILGKLKLKS